MKSDDGIPDLIDEDDDDDYDDDDIHIIIPPRTAAKRSEYSPMCDYPYPISRLLARITIPVDSNNGCQ